MTVAFGAVGTTVEQHAFASSINATLTQALGSDPHTALIVGVSADSNGDNGNLQTSLVTAGGTAMTLLGRVDNGFQFEALYGAINPASGAVSATVSGANVGRGILLNSLIYTGVSGFGTVVKNSGNSGGAGAVSLAGASAAAGGMIVNLLGGSFLGTLSGYTQTQRSNVTSSDNYENLLLGDAGPGPSVGFACTTTASSVWTAIAAELLAVGAAPAPTNQFFVML